MPGRIRRSVETAMSQVDSTAATAMALLLRLASEGIVVELESVAGLPIPKTQIRIKLADEE